jgi:hypothetical protein
MSWRIVQVLHGTVHILVTMKFLASREFNSVRLLHFDKRAPTCKLPSD